MQYPSLTSIKIVPMLMYYFVYDVYKDEYAAMDPGFNGRTDNDDFDRPVHETERYPVNE
jgi:hypothetical protein